MHKKKINFIVLAVVLIFGAVTLQMGMGLGVGEEQLEMLMADIVNIFIDQDVF